MPDDIQVDAQQVIAALHRQVGELAYRLAVAEAEVAMHRAAQGGNDGEA